MKQARWRSIPTWALMCLAGPLCVALVWMEGAKQRGVLAAVPALGDWDVERMTVYLADNGLHFHVVSSAAKGAPSPGVFLTMSETKWQQLNLLIKSPEAIQAWQGTVYCERQPNGDSRELQVAQWGDCCLIAGPFLFFGDKELLAQIRSVLLLPETSER